MEQPMILVTGAAGGRQGSTGHRVARLLLDRGVRVRALVHRIDERSDDLRARGADVVEGDFLDLASIRRAMRDIRRAYFAYPVQPQLLEATTNFAAAAREGGVERIVNLSQLLKRDGEQATPHQARHWLAEQIFDWANVGAVHLEAVVFYENLYALARGSLAKADVIALPWGAEDTAFPMIAAEDVARVATAILTGPPVPNGTIVPLVGGVVAMREMAETFSALLGRRVRYVEITDEQWVQNVAGAGINPAALEHLTHLWRYLRTRSRAEQAAYRVSEAIERLTGAPARTLRQALEEQPLAVAGAPSRA